MNTMNGMSYLSSSSPTLLGPGSTAQYSMSSYHHHPSQYGKLSSPYNPACEATKLHTTYTTAYSDQTNAAFPSAPHTPLGLGISAAQRLAAAF